MPALDTVATDPLAPPPGDDGWYIAIDDETVGPFSFSELEMRARQGELDPEQLAWTVGMSDWLPVSDLPRLALLLPEELAIEEVPLAEAPVSWKPQAAAALSALVEQVEVEPKADAAEAEAPDPFGDLPPMTFIAAEAPAWRMPQPDAPAASGSRRPLILFAALTVVGCVAGVLVGLLLASGERSEAAEAARVRDTLARVAPQPRVRTTAPTPVEPEPATEIELNRAPMPVVPPSPPEPPVSPEPRENRRRRLPPVPSEPEISMQQVAKAALSQRESLKPCIRNAISARELAPGTYGLVASWVIAPQGKMLKPRLVGPSQVMSTSLPACVARVMREWTFPAPGVRLPVKGFPLASVRVR